MVEKDQDIKLNGKWWMPDNADQVIIGKLTIESNNHIIVIFEDFLFKKTSYILGDIEKFDILLGQTYNNELVTLINCTSGYTLPDSGGLIPVSILTAEFAIIGAHFKTKEEVLFSNIDVYYSNLEQWAFIWGFNHTPDSTLFHPRTPANHGEIIIQYNNPKPIELTKTDDITTSLEFCAHAPVSWGKIEISQLDYIRIKSSKLLPFIKYENIIKQYQNFFTLAMNQPVYITKLEGHIDKKQAADANLTISEHLKRYDPIPIKICSNLINKKENDIHFHQMLFTYYNIRDKYATVINNWFAKTDRFESIFDLYFGTIYNPYMYSQRFINIVHALESYHRLTMNHSKIPHGEFREMKRDILEKAPEHADLLNELFSNSNQLSLLTRLFELYERYDRYLDDSINEQFFIDVKDTRNYLTHREKKPANLLVGDRLDIAAFKLKILFELYLLLEIGFNIEEIIPMFRKHGGEYAKFFKSNV